MAANFHTVRIVTSVDNIPFHFVDENGKTKGMLVDMWRLWAKQNGNEVDFVSVPWAQSLDMVKRGDAHIHANAIMGMTEITLQSPLNAHQVKNLNAVKTSARHYPDWKMASFK